MTMFKLRKHLSILLVAIIFLSSIQGVQAESADVIDERWGMPVVVYGETLSESQKNEVRQLLEVTDTSQVEEIIVTAQDLHRLIGGNPNSGMYSSAKITLKDSGHGLVVTRVNPDYITQVTEEMYANALLTAGIENASVEVASPLKVTGHSALVGIYKAYESRGGELEQGRMEVANEELDLATDLANKEGLTDEKVGELLTEIKKMIAEQNPATREDVERIVEEQLNRLEITLSPEDRQLLIDLFEKMRSLDIDFGNVRQQLEDLTKDLRDRVEQVVGDEGFWDSVSRFFKRIFDAIANLFK